MIMKRQSIIFHSTKTKHASVLAHLKDLRFSRLILSNYSLKEISVKSELFKCSIAAIYLLLSKHPKSHHSLKKNSSYTMITPTNLSEISHSNHPSELSKSLNYSISFNNLIVAIEGKIYINNFTDLKPITSFPTTLAYPNVLAMCYTNPILAFPSEKKRICFSLQH